MSRLSDFAKNFKPKENQEEIQVDELRQNFSQEKNKKIDDGLNKAWGKYEGMDQNQLYQELFKEAGKLKENGKFDYNSLYNSIESMGSHLSPEQKQTMLNLLERLR